MYVVSGLFALLIKTAGFSGDSILNIFASISGTGVGFNLPIVNGLWILFYMLAYFIVFALAAIAIILTALIGGLNIFGALVGIAFLLMSIWVLVLAIIYTFKIPFVLIKTLITLYLSIITSPVQLLAGTVVPSMSFGNWFKRLMADVLVFPLVGLLLWFAWQTLLASFVQSFGDIGRAVGIAAVDQRAWVPGIIGAGTGLSGVIMLGISFGLIVMVPKVPDLLKSLLLGERFSFGTAIGEAYGPVKGIAGSAGGVVQGVTMGSGAIKLGGELEKSKASWVQSLGKNLRGYGQRQVGGLMGSETKSISKTRRPQSLK
jgi:hypothetical protein